jgi:hypothetical protein
MGSLSAYTRVNMKKERGSQHPVRLSPYRSSSGWRQSLSDSPDPLALAERNAFTTQNRDFLQPWKREASTHLRVFQHHFYLYYCQSLIFHASWKDNEKLMYWIGLQAFQSSKPEVTKSHGYFSFISKLPYIGIDHKTSHKRNPDRTLKFCGLPIFRVLKSRLRFSAWTKIFCGFP